MSSTKTVIKPDVITKEQFVKALPKGMSTRVTDDMVNSLNGLMTDQMLRENFRDNLLSYTSVLQDGRYKIQSYIDAVKYVSYKLLKATNVVAYSKTFPDRYQRLIDEEADEKVISSYCAAYNKTQLVQKIMEQTLVPTHVLNADLHQKAINRLAYLMMSANSEKVQADSATALLTHLKQPETQKVELEVTTKQDKVIDELRAATQQLVNSQRSSMVNKEKDITDIAESTIINVQAEEV